MAYLAIHRCSKKRMIRLSTPPGCRTVSGRLIHQLTGGRFEPEFRLNPQPLPEECECWLD
jgi:hypothetical protein